MTIMGLAVRTLFLFGTFALPIRFPAEFLPQLLETLDFLGGF